MPIISECYTKSSIHGLGPAAWLIGKASITTPRRVRWPRNYRECRVRHCGRWYCGHSSDPASWHPGRLSSVKSSAARREQGPETVAAQAKPKGAQPAIGKQGEKRALGRSAVQKCPQSARTPPKPKTESPFRRPITPSTPIYWVFA